MAVWLMEFRDHDGGTLGTFLPENFDFTLRMGADGPNEWTHEISLADPGLRRDLIIPYQADWYLSRDGASIDAGMVTSVNGRLGDEYFTVAGKNWLHYLERRHYPFMPAYATGDVIASGTGWSTSSGTMLMFPDTALIEDIVQTILENVRDWDNSYSLDYTVTCDYTGCSWSPNSPTDGPYTIEFGDTEWIYDKIQALSQLPKENGGFEFEITPAKVFRLYYPGKAAEGIANWIFRYEPDGSTSVLDLEYTNTGPDGTHYLVTGAGVVYKDTRVRHFRENSAVYRRLDATAEFSNVKSDTMLSGLASEALSFGANPVHEITMSVNAEAVPDFWQIIFPGAYIYVKFDLGFHQIDSIQKVVSMDCHITNEGEETVTLNLNQYYSLSGSAGLPDA